MAGTEKLKKVEEKRGGKRIFWVVVTALVLLAGFSFPRKAVDNALGKDSLLSAVLSDPLIHICAFGFFALVLRWYFREKRENNFFYGKVALYALGYGLFIEIYQIFIPSRSFGVIDLFFDGAGISLALVALAVLKRINNMRHAVGLKQ